MAPGDFLPSPSPRLEDLKSCEDWLAHTAPADTPHSCSALLTLLGEIENAPPRHSVYLQILERLRYPVLLAGAEQAKRFAGKPLPLSQGEAAGFVQATHLWTAMLRGYARLLGASLSGKHSELEHSFARLCHRVLACSGEFIGACLLARREFGTDCWKLIHQAYTAAEARGVAAETVADLSVDSSPMAAFAEVLMLQLAQPSRLSHRELGWARRWIRHWSRKAPLGREAPSRGGYAVDLAGHSGPAWVKSSAGPATRRFLDLNRVVHSVNARIRRLEEGADPAVLGLGSDCARLAAQDLLKTLGRAWSDSVPVRDFPKRKSASPMELVSGFAAIHHAIEGRSAARSASPSNYSYGEAERLHTFQRVAEPTAAPKVRERGAENWETLEESDDGFRLRCTMPGMRLAHRQLVALRPGGARRFILCHIDWLIEGPDQTLTIGARALKGVAKACAVRWTDHSAQQRSDALMLPVAPGLAPALVLPAGRHQHARELELKLGNAVSHVTLSGLIERGFDYESFSVS